MKSYREWEHLKPGKNLKKDKNGGIVPQDMKVAKKVDLITLPPDVEGTNCGNCRFITKENKFCTHPDVQQYVNERMCCAFWDHQMVERPWEKD